tara:strand:- start:835 stop:1110 length:276 start_codon:yes stop_codon:yes gene_type:complete
MNKKKKVEEKCSRKQCLVLEHKVKESLQPTKYEYLSSVQREIEFITKKINISNDQLFEALVYDLVQRGPILMGGSESVVNALLYQINERKN